MTRTSGGAEQWRGVYVCASRASPRLRGEVARSPPRGLVLPFSGALAAAFLSRTSAWIQRAVGAHDSQARARKPGALPGSLRRMDGESRMHEERVGRQAVRVEQRQIWRRVASRARRRYADAAVG
ncbi:hypothetical protein NDU88_004664 [Pleurodeles waltl]|uniref:Uncharacterized protein n=1 Tax=Pleurodeles waltl TaxID=8319 RepID=A0AAV7T890_PLEWA|nr:hypothetical protein NDU88_004664 [Pleurodeles waltl]